MKSITQFLPQLELNEVPREILCLGTQKNICELKDRSRAWQQNYSEGIADMGFRQALSTNDLT